MDKARRTALAGAAALVIALVIAPAASALDQVNTNPLRKAVTVNGILHHERALQAIANTNVGTRASGTAGFDQLGRLRQAPARARPATRSPQQPFDFPFLQETAPAVSRARSPRAADRHRYEFATLSTRAAAT